MTIRPDPSRDDDSTEGDDGSEGEEPSAASPPSVEGPGAASLPSAPLDQAIGSGASWMIWIALLTLVNVALTAGGSDMSFAIGLVVSQLLALIGVTIADGAHTPALAWVFAAIAAVPALAFGALWFPARQGKPWVFVVAMAAYGLDLGILLAILLLAGEMDVIGIGIHAWALWALWRGWSASKQPA
jgi:hypothetical protein